MSVLANIFLFSALQVIVFQRLRTLLTYFQQDEYDGRRFIGSWRTVRLYDVKASFATVLASGLLIAGVNVAITSFLLTASLLAIAFMERSHRYKKPLSETKRAMRIFWLTSAALGLLSILFLFHLLMVVLVLQIAPLVLVAVNILLRPFESRINQRFEHEARVKLERLNPVRIGITGSFGKTTVKHMLAEILEASAPVYFSRGSINTVLGHTRHIRQRLQWSHRYFIAEMGAYGIGSIKRLCDFVHPQYGIVTAVGDAHMERFGSLDAIAHAKSELAEDVCANGGTVVINSDLLDYEPFRAVRERHGKQAITVGRTGADVEVKSVALAGGSWAISLCSTDPRIPSLQYDLPLVGDHNVINSALAVTLALVIDPAIVNQIPFFTRTIAQVPHRLQKVGSTGSALILDDAYNSNELGFISAVSAMNRLAHQRGGRRILVTPGIAELGLEHDRVHDRLGSFCSTNCDIIYVVNSNRIKSFVRSAKNGSAKVIEVPTFAAARTAVSDGLRVEDVLLYENDLPDLLEEKRLL